MSWTAIRTIIRFSDCARRNRRRSFTALPTSLSGSTWKRQLFAVARFIVVHATPNRHTDQPILFVLKCDFEPKIARITDERNLISHVEMAISARNMKSIQYPHMPEEGMLEYWELKIHQASHARYFEDFLRFVSYEKAMPELMSEQMLTMVHEYMEDKWQGHEGEDRQQEAQQFEVWAASEKRELQESWPQERVDRGGGTARGAAAESDRGV